MKTLCLLAALSLSGCATIQASKSGPKWELKAECGGGGKWNEHFESHAEIACGLKLETTLIEGGN